MKKAIFFDRDGVLVKAVYHSKTNTYGGPWKVNELQLYDVDCIKKLQDKYQFFLISNQPDAKKFNTTINDLELIHQKFHRILQSKNIEFLNYYYCYHAKFDQCICRKPLPYFIFKAAETHNINLTESWMIGDKDTDVECGKRAGTKTIKVIENIGNGTNNLNEIVEMILNENIP